jgi:DNA-binding PadR family transcriptional regulator
LTAIHASFTEPPFDRTVRRLAMALSAMAGGGSKHHHHPRSHHQHRGPGGHGPRGWGGRGRGGFPFDVFGGPPFGRPAGPGGPFGWRPKARRGDVRLAALLLLAEEPRNGYGIMQELEQRSGGAWRPSPGSVYPALQQLDDEGLVRTEEHDGRKVYELTDAGRAHIAERPQDEPAPWETMAGGGVSDAAHEAGGTMRDVALAFLQVLHAGSEAQVAEAGRILADTRKALYRILADGDPGGEGERGPAGEA